MRVWFVAPIILALQAGCAAVAPPYHGPTEYVIEHVPPERIMIERQGTEFEPHIEYSSPLLKEGYRSNTWLFGLYVKKDRESGARTNFIQAANIYTPPAGSGGSWKHWQDARSREARALEFARVDSDVSCGYGSCTHTETFNIYIPESLMRPTEAGLRVKVYARSGDEMILRVPPNILTAMETALE